MNNLKLLEGNVKQARDALREHQKREDHYESVETEKRVAPLKEAMEAQEAAIKAECSELFDDRDRELRNAVYEANRAHELGIVEAKNGNTGWLPVGTVIVKWERPRYTYGRGPLKLTDQVGMVEVWSPDSVYPENKSRYSRPHAGDIVVRLLKKDGTPSKNFESANEWNRVYWQAKGVDANIAKEAK